MEYDTINFEIRKGKLYFKGLLIDDKALNTIVHFCNWQNLEVED